MDENSHPNGRNAGSVGAQYYFSPKFTRIGEPTKSEKNSDQKASHSLLCEFNQSQKEQDKEGCSEHSVFRWLKEGRPKHVIILTRQTIVTDIKNSRGNKQAKNYLAEIET